MMKFTVILCTYMRAESLARLLESIKGQTAYPDQILVIDGSVDDFTKNRVAQLDMHGLVYHKVPDEERGLTRQRNYGIRLKDPTSEVVCYLDDDTILEPDYFQQILSSFEKNQDVIGVGGVDILENRWEAKRPGKKYPSKKYYELDGSVVKEGLRNVLRNYLGLASPLLPGRMPDFSHGRTCGYPLNDKSYEVDLLIGMAFSFRSSVFESLKFSPYFEGYGLYEDADFCIRAQQYGKLIINTAAKLRHYHEASGRPNKYQYGKMVIRNGWYVWRLKYPRPGFRARLKWFLTNKVLIGVRLLNIVNTSNRMEALTDAMGRFTGLLSLVFNKPRISR